MQCEFSIVERYLFCPAVDPFEAILGGDSSPDMKCVFFRDQSGDEKSEVVDGKYLATLRVLHVLLVCFRGLA